MAKVPHILFTIRLISLSLIFSGCSSSSTTTLSDGTEVLKLESPTMGTARIVSDESFGPIMKEVVDLFNYQKPEAEILFSSKSEKEAYRDLMQDSVRLVIGTRELVENELKEFKRLQIVPTIVHVANDAIALVLNKKNPVRKLEMDQIKNILSGKISNWNEIDPTMDDKEILLVFDHPYSSTMRFIRESVLKGDSLSKKVFAARSNGEVLEYLQEVPNAIGIVGMNWVTNLDDSLTSSRMEKLIPISLPAPDSSTRKGQYFGPYQAPVVAGDYPLSRKVYCVSREYFLGVGTGFVNYISGETGQRVLLKAGMAPVRTPPRFIIMPTD